MLYFRSQVNRELPRKEVVNTKLSISKYMYEWSSNSLVSIKKKVIICIICLISLDIEFGISISYFESRCSPLGFRIYAISNSEIESRRSINNRSIVEVFIQHAWHAVWYESTYTFFSISIEYHEHKASNIAFPFLIKATFVIRNEKHQLQLFHIAVPQNVSC